MAKRTVINKREASTSFFDVAVGAVFIVTALLLAVAMFSYSPDDPSLNNATNTSPVNFLGLAGSYTADLLLQLFALLGGFIMY